MRLQIVLNNVSPGGKKGAVAVTMSPFNYEYHGWTWVRDAALMMRQAVRAFESSTSSVPKAKLLEMLRDYAAFNKKLQDSVGLSNLGEPRFDFDGRPYTGPWGRPQNDGPALRVLTLAPLGTRLLQSGDPDLRQWVDNLYVAEPYDRPQSILKRDLEYIARNFQEKSFDLWEESKGLHFYTLLVQRAALIEGAKLARMQNDPFAADHYQKTAEQISRLLESFWNPEKRQVDVSSAVEHEHVGKHSRVDIAVILGVLHSPDNAPSFSVRDDRILATALKIEQTFEPLYLINRIKQDDAGNRLGPAIGRYPEDRYNGHPDERLRFTGAHPWVLATTGMAEYYFTLAADVVRQGEIKISDTNRPFFEALLNRSLREAGPLKKDQPLFNEVVATMKAKGISFANRVTHHLGANGTLPEMIHRETGQAQSIPSLGWSDTSVLSMLAAFRRLSELQP